MKITTTDHISRITTPKLQNPKENPRPDISNIRAREELYKSSETAEHSKKKSRTTAPQCQYESPKLATVRTADDKHDGMPTATTRRPDSPLAFAAAPAMS